MLTVNNEIFSKDILKDLAYQVGFMGAQACTDLFKTNEGKIQLAETLPRYVMDIFNIQEEGYQKISATPDGFHHQIWFDKKALAFAISRFSEKDNAWEIVRFSKSGLADAINKAIIFIEEDDNENRSELEVRLLELPLLQLYAFWLLSGEGTNMQTEKLLFVNYCLYDRDIKCHIFFSESEFIAKLRELNPIIGVTLPAGEDPYRQR